MKEIFFTGDTHFCHKNILRYSQRTWDDIQEHDENIISNWNNTVNPNDDVYFLGDFCMAPVEKALSIRKRLNGNIFFIEGNHDKTAQKIASTFSWYKEVAQIKIPYGEDLPQLIYLCHYAMRVWNKSHYGSWNLYGHSHGSLPELETSLSMDVGIDAMAIRRSNGIVGAKNEGLKRLREHYAPVSFDEVRAILRKREFSPIDHHEGK